ncbi:MULTISPECIES: CHAP domain-containing protein [Streptomyces]|uniref:CHAP domain-containing protein n=1 Tax=Streptomyces TaxID=1883 RepID=UPI00131D735F|nr:CHAP domain-containing protein [Streptomyces sp. NRRL S-146]
MVSLTTPVPRRTVSGALVMPGHCGRIRQATKRLGPPTRGCSVDEQVEVGEDCVLPADRGPYLSPNWRPPSCPQWLGENQSAAKKGAIVFFDWNGKGIYDHAGVITKVKNGRPTSAPTTKAGSTSRSTST